MEEYAFLVNALPQHRAKVLAIWDPAAPNGDFDCCLALPYPTFIGDYPKLEWHILGQQDVDEARLGGLDFDYYYPGSLVAVDVDHVNDWFIGRLFPDPDLTARQQAPLRSLQSIDAFVRSLSARIEHQGTRPAHTLAGRRSDDRMTLTSTAVWGRPVHPPNNRWARHTRWRFATAATREDAGTSSRPRRAPRTAPQAADRHRGAMRRETP
jgi:hypothetical protein